MNLKRIFLLGDIGFFNINLHNIVNTVKLNLKMNDIIVLLGDNFYPNGIRSYHDKQIVNYQKIFNNINNPIYSIIGNHDYLLNPKAQINNTNWIMPNFYYKKEYDNVNLYFLDTVILDKSFKHVTEEKIIQVHKTHVNKLIKDQLKWLKKDMKKNKNKQKIVFGHYPAITNGMYKHRVYDIYNQLIDIFKKYNVKTYISGHEHNVQYITRYIDNYKFNQIIIGSSAEFRNDADHSKLPDMYDKSDNYFGLLTIDDNYDIKFINNMNDTKHKFIL